MLRTKSAVVFFYVALFIIQSYISKSPVLFIALFVYSLLIPYLSTSSLGWSSLCNVAIERTNIYVLFALLSAVGSDII